ncbi:hypothetical protein F4777DRAFT_249567 [Nemania sp. FL0916]|nr:hypothetical protein F4777DRAFT_249567 [Nemania sp. FL0916]
MRTLPMLRGRGGQRSSLLILTVRLASCDWWRSSDMHGCTQVIFKPPLAAFLYAQILSIIWGTMYGSSMTPLTLTLHHVPTRDAIILRLPL